MQLVERGTCALLAGAQVLLFDTVWVPMQVFPEEAQISLSWLMSLTTIYWFGDIFVTLNTAIYSQRGEVDSRRVKIFCAYAARPQICFPPHNCW